MKTRRILSLLVALAMVFSLTPSITPTASADALQATGYTYTITYTKPNDWETVYCHYWDNNGHTTTWPGSPMEPVGNNVYQLVITTDYYLTGVKFSDSGQNETDNLLSECARITRYKFRLSFDSGWSDTYVYCFYEKDTNTIYKNAEWPGVKLTDNGTYDGLLTLDFIPEKIIFNNGSGGSGNQTADLSFAYGSGTDSGVIYRICNEEHTWGDWHVTTPATCTTAGEKQHTCTVCGATEEQAVSATGHNMTHHAATPATCTTEGNSEYWSCSACNKYFGDANGTNEIAADNWVIPIDTNNHNFGTPTYSWSEENGWKCTAQRVCSRDANHKEIETVTATSEVVTGATCTTAGLKRYTATFSNSAFDVQTRDVSIPATGNHTLTKHEAVPATCTAPGNSAYWECTVCHHYFDDENGANEIAADSWVIPASGHSLTAHPAAPRTCTTDGNRAYWECTVCHHYFDDENGAHEIAANSWVDHAIGHIVTKHDAVPKSCNTPGSSAYWSCSECGKFFDDEQCTHEIAANSWVIPASHNLTHSNAAAANCTTDGNIEYWYCTVCNKYFSDAEGTTEITQAETVVAAHHTLTKHDKVPATCTTAGSIAYWECTVCGKLFWDDAGTQETTLAETVEQATGHSYSNGVCEHCGGYQPWEGAGTVSSPYRIENAGNLALLAVNVNGGNSYNGVYFSVTNEIDLGGADWTPIGTASHPFQGILDGKNNMIKNLTITKPEESYIALFGYVGGGTTEIKDLILSGFNIFAKKRVAGLIAEVVGDATISNCEIDIDSNIFAVDSNVAGLIAEIYPSANCTVICSKLINHASVTGYGGVAQTCRAAGICAQTTNGANVVANVTFTECENHGEITSENAYAGGILCAAQGSGSSETFDACENEGYLTGEYKGDLNAFLTGDKHTINIVNHIGDIAKALCTLQHGSQENYYFITVDGTLYAYRCVRNAATVEFGNLYSSATEIPSTLLDDFRSFAAYLIEKEPLHRSDNVKGCSGTSTDKEIFCNAMTNAVTGNLVAEGVTGTNDYRDPAWVLGNYNTENNTSYDISFFKPGWSSDVLYKVVETVKVNFNANDNATPMTMQIIHKDEATALTANGFMNADSVFAGWDTAANGTGTHYDDQDTVTLSANTILYAQWTAAVARVKGTLYETFAEAVAARTSENDVITLLANVDAPYTLAENATLKVECGTFELTVNPPAHQTVHTSVANGVTTFTAAVPVVTVTVDQQTDTRTAAIDAVYFAENANAQGEVEIAFSDATIVFNEAAAAQVAAAGDVTLTVQRTASDTTSATFEITLKKGTTDVFTGAAGATATVTVPVAIPNNTKVEVLNNNVVIAVVYVTNGTVTFTAEHFSEYVINTSIDAWEGLGTESNPFLIKNQADLALLATNVNNGNTYAGAYFRLENDISLTGAWTPIGVRGYREVNAPANAYFAGTFDGNDYAISGLTDSGYTSAYADANGRYAFGLFGATCGATIKNLTMNDVAINVTNGDSVGAIVGFSGGDLTVENCVVNDHSSVSGRDGVGGLVGRAYNTIQGTLSRVSLTFNRNSAAVSTNAGVASAKAAGIIGYVSLYDSLLIKNNENYGTITNQPGNDVNVYAAGIALFGGVQNWTAGYDLTITNNTNYGDISIPAGFDPTKTSNTGKLGQGFALVACNASWAQFGTVKVSDNGVGGGGHHTLGVWPFDAYPIVNLMQEAGRYDTYNDIYGLLHLWYEANGSFDGAINGAVPAHRDTPTNFTGSGDEYTFRYLLATTAAGGSVALDGNIDVTGMLTINNNLTIDLRGCTVRAHNDYAASYLFKLNAGATLMNGTIDMNGKGRAIITHQATTLYNVSIIDVPDMNSSGQIAVYAYRNAGNSAYNVTVDNDAPVLIVGTLYRDSDTTNIGFAVNGGTYTYDVGASAAVTLPTGSVAVNNNNGTWTVGTVVATVTTPTYVTTEYTSFAAAVAAAQPGDKIDLRTDINLGEWTPVNIDGVTLNGNSKTITYTITNSENGFRGGLFNTVSGNCWIKSLNIHATIDAAGLDARVGGLYAQGGTNANVTIEDVVVDGTIRAVYYAAGVVGMHRSGSVNFRHVTNNAYVTSLKYASGILGSGGEDLTALEFVACTNVGPISGDWAGAICANLNYHRTKTTATGWAVCTEPGFTYDLCTSTIAINGTTHAAMVYCEQSADFPLDTTSYAPVYHTFEYLAHMLSYAYYNNFDTGNHSEIAANKKVTFSMSEAPLSANTRFNGNSLAPASITIEWFASQADVEASTDYVCYIKLADNSYLAFSSLIGAEMACLNANVGQTIYLLKDCSEDVPAFLSEPYGSGNHYYQSWRSTSLVVTLDQNGHTYDKGDFECAGVKVFKAVSYVTVTFDLNGGSYTPAGGTETTDPVKVKIEKGTTVSALVPDPVNGTKILVGWYLDTTGDVAYDFSDPVTADLTLHAIWTDSTVYCTTSLTLKDCIDINIYVKDVPVADLDKYRVEYTFEGSTPVTEPLGNITPYSTDGTTNIYKFVVAECAAKEMTKEITLRVFCEDTEILTKTQSIRSYCITILNGNYDAKVKELCQAVLDYGTYAQKLFDGTTDESKLANYEHTRTTNIIEGAGWTKDAELAAYNKAEYQAPTAGWIEKITTSLSLVSRTELNFYIYKKDANWTGTLGAQVELGGSAWSNVEVSKVAISTANVWRVSVKGIPAASLDQEIKLTLKEDENDTDSVTMRFTPLTYAAKINALGDDNGTITATKLVCRALYHYYAAAKALFTSSN